MDHSGSAGTTRPLSVSQCTVCGVEYDAEALPEVCPICADERQYLADDRRQRWVDPAEYGGRIDVFPSEPGLWSIAVDGGPGIGQQAKVIVTEAGNVMVEAPASITDEAVEAVRALGPLRAIIASHPHMYGLQSQWSRALDDARVYISSLDREWLGLTPSSVVIWEKEVELVPGVVASQPGGHFPGSAVVHWSGKTAQGCCTPATRWPSTPTANRWRSCGPIRTGSRSPQRSSFASPITSSATTSTVSTATSVDRSPAMRKPEYEGPHTGTQPGRAGTTTI